MSSILKKIKNKLKQNHIVKYEDDLFIKRLRSLVIGEGMLHDGNIYLLDFAIKNMPTDGVVLEIGSYGGLSINLIIHLLQKNNIKATVINCDPWIYEGYNDTDHAEDQTQIDGRLDISREVYSLYMKNAYKQAVEFLSRNRLPHTFHLSSNELFEQYRDDGNALDIFNRQVTLGSPISFAYIDGDHSYEQVTKDFVNVDKYLMRSGFILFDDSFDGSSFGSTRFMEEMKSNENYKKIMSNPNYLFQKV